jgi:hypothetical protein
MLDLTTCLGLDQFGRACQSGSPDPAYSVDEVRTRQMVRFCPERAEDLYPRAGGLDRQL